MSKTLIFNLNDPEKAEDLKKTLKKVDPDCHPYLALIVHILDDSKQVDITLAGLQAGASCQALD